jgi:hypothetical protein
MITMRFIMLADSIFQGWVGVRFDGIGFSASHGKRLSVGTVASMPLLAFSARMKVDSDADWLCPCRPSSNKADQSSVIGRPLF